MQGELMRKLSGTQSTSDPVSSRRCMLVSNRCPGPSVVLQLQYRRRTVDQILAPLAQSVERIHGKENPGAILLIR
jgi:hypothetical protein